MTLEIIDCEQNSDQWYRARLGIPTASKFHTVMAHGQSKGSPSKTRNDYLNQLVAERCTGIIQQGFYNQHTERGHKQEKEARDAYAFLTGNEPVLVGFIRNGEKGASPDALIGDHGLLEIKTKLPHLQVATILANKVPSTHLTQIQGQLWVAERDWCDFVSYCPHLDPFIRRVYRDEHFIQKLVSNVNRFIEELLEREAQYKANAKCI